MEQTILTQNQVRVLEHASKNPVIAESYFLAGGTALAGFYLHHRYSEDLDFFTSEELDPYIPDAFVQKVKKSMNAEIHKTVKPGHITYFLHWDNKTIQPLKLDFVYRPFTELEKGKQEHGLAIASLWDITVDKLYAICHRLEARDYIDFYFAVQEVGCSMEQVVTSLEEKYEIKMDELNLYSRLLLYKDAENTPRMVKTYDEKKMQSFFLESVKEIKTSVMR